MPTAADTLRSWLKKYGSEGFLVRVGRDGAEVLVAGDDQIIDGDHWVYLPNWGERTHGHTIVGAEEDGEELKLNIGWTTLTLSYWWTSEHKRHLDQWAIDKIRLDVPGILASALPSAHEHGECGDEQPREAVTICEAAMIFEVSWLALRGDDGWVDVGFVGRDKRSRLYVHPLPGFESSMVDVTLGAARAEYDGRAEDFWEYLMERGIGGYSSFSRPVEVEADTWEEVVAVTLPQKGRIQARGE